MSFTEKEFDTIIEALECLPNKNDTRSMLDGLLGAMFCKKGDEEKLEAKMAEGEKQREAEKRRLKEESIILIGKIIQMKREAYPES